MGETIRLNGVVFTVIGVLKPKMQESNDDINRTVYIPFNTMSDLKDTHYIDGVWISYQAATTSRSKRPSAKPWPPRTTSAPPTTTPSTSPTCRTQLHQFEILSIALQVLLSMVGALTLGIAGIGLMNIMLVAVQQRTREIGVEKALGARKHHILIQFLAEALAITGVGGVGGIALAYLVSLLVGRITFYSAIAKNADRCRHPPHHLAIHRDRGHGHPRHHRPGQRHDSRHPRRQPRPHRSPALRVVQGNSKNVRTWIDQSQLRTN